MDQLKNKAKNYPLTVLVGGAVIAVSSIYFLIKLATSSYYADVSDTSTTATETRIMPSGRLVLGDGTEPGQRTGQQVFDKVCIQCHGADKTIAFSPKITHNDQWSPRISKGLDTLVKHAIEGFQGEGMMPAKGGAADLTDDEVKRAVIYMANQSGANFSENATAAPTVATASVASDAQAASATPSPASTPAATTTEQAVNGNGQSTFEQSCKACHGATSPIPGAPKITHNDDWAPRIAKGEETLYQHAIGGFTGDKGMMPAKGGNATLSDDDVKAAVHYMIKQSGG